jgi:ATP-dependent protease ClpP protease subunit
MKGETLEIIIYGSIGESWWGENITAESFLKEIEKNEKAKNILVRLNSPGGNVFDGIAIYNQLRRLKGHKTVKIEGICASIATVIAMAGDEIIMDEVSDFMIHDPTAMASGTEEDMQKTANVLALIKDNIVTAYMTKVKDTITKEDVAILMTNETWMTPPVALEKGFITNIEKSAPTPPEIKAEVFPGFFNYFKAPKQFKNIAESSTIESHEAPKTKHKEEKKAMNKEELKNQFPDVYAEIVNEGATGERNRMAALDKLAGKTQNAEALAIIASAKYDKIQNAESIAMEILDKVTSAPAAFDKPKDQAMGIAEKFEEKKNAYNKEDVDNSKEDTNKKQQADDILKDVVNFANM